MRTSTYEIILPLIGRDDKEIAGKTLLVNGLYGAIDVVDAEIAANIREENFAAIPFAMRERLAQRGHITRKDETGELADARLPPGRTLSLWIWKVLRTCSADHSATVAKHAIQQRACPLVYASGQYRRTEGSC